jgi:hypothetical protein
MNLEESKVLMNIEKWKYSATLPASWFWAFKGDTVILLHLEADLLGDLFI